MKGMIFGMGMKIQDKFNGTNKFGELKEREGSYFAYLGRDFKIIEVGDVNTIVEDNGTKLKREFSSQIVWNILFF